MSSEGKRLIDSDGRMPTSNCSKPKRTTRKKYKRIKAAGMHRRRIKKIDW